jgi:hypothetical protein
MENKFNKYFTIIFLIVIILIQLKSSLLNDEIEKYGRSIIVKFTSKDILPKTTNFYFTYNINGKKIVTANSGIHYSILNTETETMVIDNLLINCFYLAKYIPREPDKIIVDPTIRVTDTIAILKAGFTIEDIQN